MPLKVKTVALILARGGSKEIPGKNIIDIAGKPLLSYSAQAALNSMVDEVWVSTDCPTIKKVATQLGCLAMDRPKKLATDSAQSEGALLHFAETVSFERLVFIQPTSPFITSKDINKGLQLMDDYDSVVSVFKEEWLPRWTPEGEPCDWDPANRPMRQQVEDRYVENGAFYITTLKNLQASRLRYSGRIGILEMPPLRSLDINSHSDLELVRGIISSGVMKRLCSAL